MPSDSETGWTIEPLSRKRHARDAFDCGVTSLNDWLIRRAGQHERRGLARTFVLVQKDSDKVVGYYALSSHSVIYEALPEDQARGLPEIDVPVILIGRLAVDCSVQGQRLGELLLLDAFRRCEQLAEQLGVRAVEVDAIDEPACRFYGKYGFLPLADDPRHLFLPISVIKKLGLSKPRE